MSAVAKVMSNLVLILYYWLEGIVLAFVPKRLRYKSVAGETVLITGGGSGIGRLLSLKFAKLGARIVVWDLQIDGARETVKMVKEAGGEAFAYECDVSKPQNVYAAAAKVKDEVGKVTILINNAGIVTGKKFLDCPDSMIQKTFEVNSLSHFWTCKAFLKDMMDANHGHIVSIASMAGVNGVAKLTDYCASKFAAVGFEEALRMELHVDGYRGIHSTVVCPYFISTGMFDGVKPGVLSIMTPDYVTDEIVSAVLVNQEVLYLPKVFYILCALKSFAPTSSLKETLCTLSILSAMTRFSGRERNAVKKPYTNGVAKANGDLKTNGVAKTNGTVTTNGVAKTNGIVNGVTKTNGLHHVNGNGTIHNGTTRTNGTVHNGTTNGIKKEE